MASNTSKYVLELSTKLSKNSLNSMKNGFKKLGSDIGKDFSKSFKKTFSYEGLKSGAKMGAIGGAGGLLAMAMVSSKKTNEVGRAFENVANESDAIANLAQIGGGDVGRTQKLADLFKAKGLGTEDLSKMFMTYADAVGQGKVQGKMTMEDFEKTLSSIMSMKGEGKLKAMLDIFGARRGEKATELLNMTPEEAKAVVGQLYGTRTNEQVAKENEAITKAEDKLAIEKTKQDIEKRGMFGEKAVTTKGTNELIATSLYEQSKINKSLEVSLNGLTNLLKSAETERKGEELLNKGLVEGINQLVRFAEMMMRRFG